MDGLKSEQPEIQGVGGSVTNRNRLTLRDANNPGGNLKG